jgi:hypothetical protein
MSLWDMAPTAKFVMDHSFGEPQEQSTALLVMILTIIWKNGCSKASLMVIRFFGSTTSSLRIKSLGGSESNNI